MSNKSTRLGTQLSDAELTLVRRLRRRELGWRRMRWAVVFVGLLISAGSVFMLERIWNTVSPDQILIILCTIAAPISGITLFAGLVGMSYAFVYWNGFPAMKLLLRLSNETKSK